jgi:hypothetical protein
MVEDWSSVTLEASKRLSFSSYRSHETDVSIHAADRVELNSIDTLRRPPTTVEIDWPIQVSSCAVVFFCCCSLAHASGQRYRAYQWKDWPHSLTLPKASIRPCPSIMSHSVAAESGAQA